MIIIQLLMLMNLIQNDCFADSINCIMILNWINRFHKSNKPTPKCTMSATPYIWKSATVGDKGTTTLGVRFSACFVRFVEPILTQSTPYLISWRFQWSRGREWGKWMMVFQNSWLDVKIKVIFDGKSKRPIEYWIDGEKHKKPFINE